MEVGYALSSEEHGPLDLVRNAERAEEAGFGFALVSDHYHPWIDRQGHSSFAWSVVGGIAASTSSIRLGTGVTCPLIRIHPAIVAQAAATSAALMPVRFFLGVGTGGHTTRVATADVAAQVVLRNNVVVGSVNANKRHWYKAGEALARADRSWLARLVTRRERPEDFVRALQRTAEDIKVVVQFAEA